MNKQINVSMNGQRFKRANVGRNEYRIFQTDVPKTIQMLELPTSGTLEYRSVGILERWDIEPDIHSPVQSVKCRNKYKDKQRNG
jgi:hypothetical protein